jgi:hypothetical protein
MRLRLLALTFALLGITAPAFAQTTDTIAPDLRFQVAFTQDGLDTEGFRLYQNGLVVQTQPVTALVNGQGAFDYPAGLSAGTYVLFVEAYNGPTAGDSATLTLTVGSPPPPPPPPPTFDPLTLTASTPVGLSYVLTIIATGDDVHNVALDGVVGILAGATCTGAVPNVCTVTVPKTQAASGLYTHTVTAIHSDGSLYTPRTVTVTLAPPPSDVTPPSVPTNLAASQITQTSLALTWSASTDTVGVVGYGVYRAGILIQTVTGPVSSLTGLVCSTSYELAVDAVDAAGNRSAPASLTVPTLACDPPPPPPPSTTLVVTAKVTSCLFTLTDTPPDATTGWSVQFRRASSATSTTWTNIGTVDSTTPYTRSTTLSIGTYYFSALWMKAGVPNVVGVTVVQACQ